MMAVLVNANTKFTLQLRIDDEQTNLKNNSGIKIGSKFESAGRLWWLEANVVTVNGFPKLRTWIASSKISSESVTAKCNIRFLSNVVHFGECCWTFHTQNNKHCFASSFAVKHILDRKCGFLRDGSVTIEVDVAITSIDDFVLRVTQSPSVTFCEYPIIKRSRLDGPPIDFDVIANDGTRFGCHIFVLKNNSVFRNYIKKMPSCNVPGTDNSCDSDTFSIEVTLKDMSGAVLRIVLSHIYHGSLLNFGFGRPFDAAFPQLIGDVLLAAETHDLPLLKQQCEGMMTVLLKVDNFLDHLMVADLTNLKKLKDACLLFWSKHGREIMKTEDWDKFMDSKDKKNKALTRSLIERLLD